MSRTFYILAGALALFAALALALACVPSRLQPGLPANASLWRTCGLFALVASLGCALIGVLTHLFEQVDRRTEQNRLARRRLLNSVVNAPAHTPDNPDTHHDARA